MSIIVTNEKSVVSVEFLLVDALNLIEAETNNEYEVCQNLTRAYNKYLEAGMVAAEYNNAGQLTEVLGMAVACADDLDISWQDVEDSIKEILDTWPGVISWEEVLNEVKGLNREHQDIVNEDSIEDQVEKIDEQTKIILTNADGVSPDQIKQVGDAGQQVKDMVNEIQGVTSDKPLESVYSQSHKLGFYFSYIMDVLNEQGLIVHFTNPQYIALRRLSNCCSLQEALTCDSVFAKDSDFRIRLFSKMIKQVFRKYVQHLSAINDIAAMDDVVKLWKIWYNIFFKNIPELSDPSRKIFSNGWKWAIDNPSKYDYEAEKKHQKGLKFAADKSKLDAKYGSDVDVKR